MTGGTSSAHLIVINHNNDQPGTPNGVASLALIRGVYMHCVFRVARRTYPKHLIVIHHNTV
jgi:hypothetical protein